MKHTRIRAFALYLLVLLFITGTTIFIYKFVTAEPNWAMHTNNLHMVNGLDNSGKIYDRNGVVLAKSANSTRVYNEDKNKRTALLHIIGDQKISSNSSIQSCYSDILFGYNIFNGFGPSLFFNKSHDITLTIDSELCKNVYMSLAKYKGAAVAYNYKTGEVLCIVSSPSYDPNNIPNIENDKTGKYEGVCVNRAMSASYTPGSIFKVVTAISSINNIDDLDNRTFTCTGEKVIDGDKIICHSKHGKLNFKNAMANSCNIALGELAIELGKEKMTETADRLGFNKNFNIDDMKVEKSTYNVKGASNIDLAWSGIGQYNDLTNAVHMMIIMGAIANEGVPVRPYIIKNAISDNNSNKRTGNLDRMMGKSTASKMVDIMNYTASTYRIFSNQDICAKTGTGEVGNNKANGWIVGFNKNSRYPIAFAVVTEKSGFGISTAAPIAKVLVDRFIATSK